ncbi:glycosyltransferase family 4 protein [Spirulina sp. CS-785/01]|uniref:glycosyltransferase family 4 protein n=1 Tax=Spirulina sp. CS-785/01 TaxID=3021716 RepID=UPI002330BA08|nr:glycosyltransferase family 4 protein [Spirulina sp. CS-785/01]MDB9315908.1 glycosyltransferase family 4 protein [Spirulina sp. CS-785/01]
MIHACYRQSRAATLTTAAMLTTHRLWGTWQNLVDIYIALTEFAREKFIEGGLPSDKIVVKPHFVFPDPGRGNGQGGYALFVGRLSQEKGLDVLLQSWEYLSSDIPLKVVGEGPLVGYVKEVVQRWPQVDYLGGCTLEEVYRLMQKATVVIVPSVWYETFGRVVIEAFAVGTPVIVTQIGAIAELVEEGRTGLHFALGDAEDLAAKVDWIFSHPQAVAQMRKEARFAYETHYTAQVNYEKLLEIYDLARSRKNLSK